MQPRMLASFAQHADDSLLMSKRYYCYLGRDMMT